MGLLDFLSDPQAQDDMRQRAIGLLGSIGGRLTQGASEQLGAANSYFAPGATPQQQQDAIGTVLGGPAGLLGMIGATKYSLPSTLKHGSSERGLEKLTLEGYGKTNPGLYGKGVYLSESPGYAEGYAKGAYGRPVGSVYDVSHGLKNPYIWPSKDAIKGGIAGDVKILDGAKGPEDITAALTAAGHDGVVVLAKTPKRGVYAHEVVVFNPEQTQILGRE